MASTDLVTLDAIRRELEAAENAGDADSIVAALSDDAVFMVPHVPACEGKPASEALLRGVLADLHAYYNRRITYVSAEVFVDGGIAIDRGTFTVAIEKKDGADPSEFSGKYLWLYRKHDVRWRLARAIVSLDEGESDEPAPERPAAPEVIETARLRLRRPAASDVDAIFSGFASDPAVTPYVGWPRHTSREDTEGFIAFSDAEWARSPAGPCLIESRETGELLGCTGLGFETPYRASTGYVLATNAWRKGYATEALTAMVDLARAHGVLRLYAIVHPTHEASIRVLKKCGFTPEAQLARYVVFPNLSPEPQDVIVYTRLF